MNIYYGQTLNGKLSQSNFISRSFKSIVLGFLVLILCLHTNIICSQSELWSYTIDSVVSSVALSPKGNFIAVGMIARTSLASFCKVYLLDKSGQLLQKFQFGTTVHHICISASSDYALIGIGAESSFGHPLGYFYLINRNGEKNLVIFATFYSRRS